MVLGMMKLLQDQISRKLANLKGIEVRNISELQCLLALVYFTVHLNLQF